MNNPARIGILYSYAPHFTRAIKHVRMAYPDAHLIAFVPTSLPEGTVAAYVNEQIVCVPEPQSPKTLHQIIHLIREIRRQQLDTLVVLFKSVKLQAVAAAGGAKETRHYDLHGNLAPIHLQPVRSLFNAITRRIIGEIRYRRIWLIVHCTSVTPQPLGKSKSTTIENNPSDCGK